MVTRRLSALDAVSRHVRLGPDNVLAKGFEEPGVAHGVEISANHRPTDFFAT